MRTDQTPDDPDPTGDGSSGGGDDGPPMEPLADWTARHPDPDNRGQADQAAAEHQHAEPPPTPATYDSGPPNRHIRIAAAIGGAILIIGIAAAAITTSSTSRSAPHHSAASATSTTAARIPPPAASTSSRPSDVPSATPPRLVVRWHGPLTINGPDADRDLDSVPPRQHSADADVTGATFDTTLTAEGDGVELATVTGTPGYQQCRDALTANGTDQTDDLNAGDVVCVQTTQHRIARLRIRHTAATFPAATIETNATVWDPPINGR